MFQIRHWANHIRHLPIHPQWLLPLRRPSEVTGRLNGNVLDVGCADRWIERHCESGANYIGLDFPPTATQLYATVPDVFANAASLPFIDGSIDVLVCLEVLEHIRDHRAALREFARILKPDGTLILSMPFLYPIHDAPHDYQRLTKFGLQRDLSSAGFETVYVRRVGNAIRAAGLLFCLALVGGLHQKRRWFDYARLPFAALGVLVVNLTTVALAMALPDWDALCTGYQVEARRNCETIHVAAES